jgi:DNA methylase
MSKQLTLPRPHLHPTVKPVALMADAIRDCSRRDGLVLDPFCGSGTILVVAERTGRRERLRSTQATSTSRCGAGRPSAASLHSLLGQAKTFETTEDRRIAKLAAA